MPSLPRIRPRRLAAPAVPPDDKRPRVTEVQGEGLTWIHWGRPTYISHQQSDILYVLRRFWAILGSFVLLIVSMLGFFRHKRWL